MSDIICVQSDDENLLNQIEDNIVHTIEQQKSNASIEFKDSKPQFHTAYTFGEIIDFLKNDTNGDYAFSCIDSFKTTKDGYGNEYIGVNTELISDSPYIMKCDQFKNFYPYIPTFPEMFIYRWRLLSDDELIE